MISLTRRKCRDALKESVWNRIFCTAILIALKNYRSCLGIRCTGRCSSVKWPFGYTVVMKCKGPGSYELLMHAFLSLISSAIPFLVPLVDVLFLTLPVLLSSDLFLCSHIWGVTNRRIGPCDLMLQWASLWVTCFWFQRSASSSTTSVWTCASAISSGTEWPRR